ncbi:class I SAM-dependent methyltransferase [Mycobacterium tuberculosis]|uniref:class I SAM-dependent methyltransferase n=1 Tax=Mycobacterium tuberculosis TaxID=1773 RepID=UPI0040534748
MKNFRKTGNGWYRKSVFFARQLRVNDDRAVARSSLVYGGCSITCLNISEVPNETNRKKNRQAGLDRSIRVIHGSFDDIPEPDSGYDVVWSQDAILHAPDRRKVLEEAFRVLRPGGELIFTDPMQADDVPDGVLQPVYDRLNLRDLGSMRFYA